MEAPFIHDSALWACKVAAVSHKELHVEHKNHQGSCWTENEDLIGKGVKYAVKDLVAYYFSAMIEESLKDILRRSVHNAQSII